MMLHLKESILSTRSNTSFISQIISAFFLGHAMTGGAQFSRRDTDAAALSPEEFNRKYR
jgi:hypothetical protein